MTPFRTPPSERIELLGGVSLFSRCTRDELRRIEALTSITEVAAGAVLAQQGATGHEFFVIAEGSVTVSRDGERLAELGPGSFFGELALLDGGPRTATVVADTPTSLIVLSRAEFNTLQLTSTSVVSTMLVELGNRMRRHYSAIDRSQGDWTVRLASL